MASFVDILMDGLSQANPGQFPDYSGYLKKPVPVNPAPGMPSLLDQALAKTGQGQGQNPQGTTGSDQSVAQPTNRPKNGFMGLGGGGN